MTAKNQFYELITTSMKLIKKRNISINDERKILEVSKELSKLREGFERSLPERKKEKFGYIWNLIFGTGNLWKWHLQNPEEMWPKIKKVLEKEEAKDRGQKDLNLHPTGVVKNLKKGKMPARIKIDDSWYSCFDKDMLKGLETGDKVLFNYYKNEDGRGGSFLNLSYLEVIEESEEPKEETKKPEKQLTKYQKVSQALKGTATPSDKALNFLFYSNKLPGIDKIEVKGKLNWQTLMVLEAVDKKFLENINLLDSEEPEKGIFKNQEDFEEFSKALVKADDTERRNNFTLEVNITSSEIKNIMDKKHFSVEKVHGLVEDLENLGVRALRFYDPSKKENKWVENGIEISLEEKASPLCPIVSFVWTKVQKRDLRGRGKVKKEYQYTCLYNSPLSWIHLHNLSMYKLDLLSNKFRQMSRNAQTFYRCIIWMKNPVKLNLDNINNFLGWKDIDKVLEDTKEKWRIQKINILKYKIKKMLKELEDNKYIEQPSIAGYGRRTGYLIHKS